MEPGKLQHQGREWNVFPHEFWYVVPARTTFSEEEAKKVRATDFALVLHNASCGEGLLTNPSTFSSGARFRPAKGGSAGLAEELLEQVRLDEFPEKPSRFNSYYLNPTKELAEFRFNDTLRGDKRIERCYVVLDGGKVHFADMDLYERLEGRPDDKELARRYWQQHFVARTPQEQARQEVLADSMLFFPDWQSFPRVPVEVLQKWQDAQG